MRRLAIVVALVVVVVSSAGAQETAPEDRIAQLSPDDLKQGESLFQAHCALCHGIGGTGGRGPSLRVGSLRRASDDQALFRIIRGGVKGTEMPPSWMFSDAEIWRLAGYIRSLGRVEREELSGDGARGRAIYESRGGCAGCHIVEGQGGSLGPDLTAIGARRGASHLREALLDPGAAAPKGRVMIRAVLADGSTVRGMRVNEDVFTIQLRDGGNRFHSLRKRELKSLDEEDKASLMPSYRDALSAAELEDVVAYLAGPAGQVMTGAPGTSRPCNPCLGRWSMPVRILALALVAVALASAQVPYDRLVKADGDPGNWLMYSRTYDAQRFSPLDQITKDNVGGLQPVWIYQIEESGQIENTPLVVDGVMYVTEPLARVTALDVHSGRPLWSWNRPMPDDVLTIGFGRTNRGVAILDETVFVGTLDAHLVALDAKSGAERWDVAVGENKLGVSITAAPLAIDGKVIVGISGGEAGVRGYLDAYDAKTGERAWRFWTIPGPGEPDHDTWGGDSWKTGGGTTWLTGAYDPETKLLFWGTGNPAPDWNGDSRPGDNLYTCSLVAVDADTGKLKWHFQFTPHDVHDWDANQIPVLLEMEIEGRRRKLVAMANRNGFYYLLDRKTGKFLHGTPYAKQTWAKGLDADGRPNLIPDKAPTPEGNFVYPSLQGSTNWASPAYSPLTRLFYVSVREMGAYYFKGEAVYKPGTLFVGGGERRLEDEAWGAVRALDASTGKMEWEFRVPSPPWCGVMATAGGLVFGGSREGNFYALDAANGEPLWQLQLGGEVRTNPISFLIDGKQQIAVAAGKAFFVFALPDSMSSN